MAEERLPKIGGTPAPGPQPHRSPRIQTASADASDLDYETPTADIGDLGTLKEPERSRAEIADAARTPHPSSSHRPAESTPPLTGPLVAETVRLTHSPLDSAGAERVSHSPPPDSASALDATQPVSPGEIPIPPTATPGPTSSAPGPIPSTPASAATDPTVLIAAAPAVAPPPRPPALVPARQPTIMGYDLLGPLGKGTFGSVWRARQVRTGALVAVKLFDRDIAMDWDFLHREIQCLLLVAKHPHVVTLLDADFVQKPPFMVTELMEGSLDQEIKRVRQEIRKQSASDDVDLPWSPYPDFRRAMVWFEEMARGLHYVHGKALLHCDLKPANVLLDDQGRVRIVDFGQSIVRGSHQLSMGTLFYMPPEQTEGVEKDEQARPDVRWDVYALGATIYSLLAGRPPRSGRKQLQSIRTAGTVATRFEVYRDLLTKTPLVPLRQVNRAMPEDFAAIVEKCLEVDPGRRYETAGEVLDDLDRMRRKDPLLCRRPWKRSYLLERFVHRNALWLIPLVALIAVLGISVIEMNRRIMRQQRVVITQMHREGGQTVTETFTNAPTRAQGVVEAEIDTYLTDLLGARDALDRGDPSRAKILLEACQPFARGWEWGYLRAKVDEALARPGSTPQQDSGARGVTRVEGLPQSSGHVQLPHDGQLVVVNRNIGEAEVLRARDGRPDPEFLDAGGVPFRAVALGRDGRTALLLRSTGEILVRRQPDFTPQSFAKHPGATAVAISPDLRRAVSIDAAGELEVWLLRNGREVLTVPVGPHKPTALEFSAAGRAIIVYHDDDSATILTAAPFAAD